MKRGKPPRRKTELKGGQPPKRKKRIRSRSKKQEAVYRVRRPLVEQLLEERPACQRCDRERSTEIHEPKMRSRGVDITDPDECVALCHGCHRHIHDNPAEATAEGWLIPSCEA